MENTLLLIDDDPMMGQVIEKHLPADSNLLLANNGDEGIEKAIQHKPSVILLDVEMPGKNGYEVCDILKHHDITRSIPVIFVSSRASLRERILGYEMGGDDYLEKPFDTVELLHKIEKIQKIYQEKIKLLSQMEQVNKTAKDAICNSSELSLMVKYQQHIQHMQSHEKIVGAFFDVTRQLGLTSCLMLDIDSNKIFYSCTGENKPLEYEMMYMLFQKQERFSHFGCRTQITYPNIALLIKNMPLNDAYRYGRMKDLLPIMMEITANKLTSIEAHLLLEQQRNDVIKAGALAKTMMLDVLGSIRTNELNSRNQVQKIFNQLQDRLPNMGLEEDQEKYIVGFVDQAVGIAYDSSSDNEQMDTLLKDIISMFEDIQRRQEEIIHIYTGKKAAEEKQNSAEHNTETLGNVELF